MVLKDREYVDSLQRIVENLYPIINTEIFDGKLKTPNIYVTPIISADGGVTAQYMHKIHFLQVSSDDLLRLRCLYADMFYDDEEMPITEDTLFHIIKRELIGTLVHEMVHQYAEENDIIDYEIKNGLDFHTEKFKELALQHGLLVKQQAPRGWCNTTLDPRHSILGKVDFPNVWAEYYPIDEYNKEQGYI